MKKTLVWIFIALFNSSFSFSEEIKISQFLELQNYCEKSLSLFPGEYSKEAISGICHQVSYLNGCYSEKDKNVIFHYDKIGTSVVGKRILVFSLFHGDEFPAGSVARYWMERLYKINPRSSWRIIPILNPDGVNGKTRTNGRGVDLNRNLPTKNWEVLALEHWEKKEGKKERRFPGKVAGSERETQCVLNHIENFNPDFIISVHTPYGVLDFDGPQKSGKPSFDHLPWKRLGTYPGSLGRYMWNERNIPVLTIELKGNEFNLDPDYLSELQDIAGLMAIRTVQSKSN
ncbi:MAG: succinylglutamate desuccinylase/aspartoacylase family protein [Halobacteriovoraceae bacterium]|nr:succinylglutamate desuccinylase/aspartoacylase family protein [Halobacteriovoraceae bacterium]MCB9095510.1 succinylglutamate desuccinylase/aspartoacylase family protein [Halobacteriovoraceae bacterium]